MNNWSARVGEFPRMAITYQAMKALPEYSCTVPTGVSVGKMWRRHDGSFDPRCRKEDQMWLIGRYEAAPPEIIRGKVTEMCKTVFYRPVIRVKMGRSDVS